MDRLTRNLLFIIFLSLLLPISGRAAVLYVEPAQGNYYPGDTFIADLRIDSENECVNIVGVDLSFSQNVLEALDFSSGDSILTLWISSPAIKQEAGTLSFTAGIPGGYCGRLLGDPGESNLLGRVIFKVKSGLIKSETARIKFLSSSQVLLNDGVGTPAVLSLKGAVLSVLPGVSETPKKEWQAELDKDKIPPEFFKIELNQSPSIFEGKYFITFSATDKQTGIDYYEVKEGRGDWQKAASPYLLENQGLRSIIKVRAVDKAGNERIAQYGPQTRQFLYWAVALVLMSLGAFAWIRHKIILKK